MPGVANPKKVRERLFEYASRPVGVMKPGERGSIINAFDRALKDAHTGNQYIGDDRRYWVWGFCFAPTDGEMKPLRSKDLTDGQWFALKKWLGARKEGDDWTIRAAFVDEARWVLGLASTIVFLQKQQPGHFTFAQWLDGLEARGEMGEDDKRSDLEGRPVQPEPPPPDDYFNSPAPVSVPAVVDDGWYIPL